MGQILTEKNLVTNKTMCYTYDSLSRLTKCEVKDENNQVLSTESFAYDYDILDYTGKIQHDEKSLSFSAKIKLGVYYNP